MTEEMFCGLVRCFNKNWLQTKPPPENLGGFAPQIYVGGFKNKGKINSQPKKCQLTMPWIFWGLVNYNLVVSNIFYCYPYLGKWSNLTNIFQRGWNHQLDSYHPFYPEEIFRLLHQLRRPLERWGSSAKKTPKCQKPASWIVIGVLHVNTVYYSDIIYIYIYTSI